MKPVTTSKASSPPAFTFTAEQIAYALQNAQVSDVPDDSSMNAHTFLLNDNNQQNAVVSHSLPELRAKLAKSRQSSGDLKV